MIELRRIPTRDLVSASMAVVHNELQKVIDPPADEVRDLVLVLGIWGSGIGVGG